MPYNYDALYGSTPNALGEPTDIFVKFFDALPDKRMLVLDIGCGQGRDALFIARKGHQVVGVDYAPNGIRDLEKAARLEGLDIVGVVADLNDYTPDHAADVLLIDRTLHMLDREARNRVLATLLEFVLPNGWVLIADEASNIPDFEKVLQASDADWTITKKSRGYLFAQRTD